MSLAEDRRKQLPHEPEAESSESDSSDSELESESVDQDVQSLTMEEVIALKKREVSQSQKRRKRRMKAKEPARLAPVKLNLKHPKVMKTESSILNFKKATKRSNNPPPPRNPPFQRRTVPFSAAPITPPPIVPVTEMLKVLQQQITRPQVTTQPPTTFPTPTSIFTTPFTNPLPPSNPNFFLPNTFPFQIPTFHPPSPAQVAPVAPVAPSPAPTPPQMVQVDGQLVPTALYHMLERHFRGQQPAGEPPFLPPPSPPPSPPMPSTSSGGGGNPTPFNVDALSLFDLDFSNLRILTKPPPLDRRGWVEEWLSSLPPAPLGPTTPLTPADFSSQLTFPYFALPINLLGGKWPSTFFLATMGLLLGFFLSSGSLSLLGLNSAIPPPLPLLDIHPNPGPQRQWVTSEYALRREIFCDVLRSFALPTPLVDLFASERAALVDSFLDSAADALSHRWGGKDGIPGLCWANPPFDIIPAVFSKILEERPRILLLVPCWCTPPLRCLIAASTAHLCLPRVPLFLQHGSDPVPPPRWDCWVLYFSGLLAFPRKSVWLPYLPADGDVEANPGPPQLRFEAFRGDLASVFTDTLDSLTLARAVTDILALLQQGGVEPLALPSLLNLENTSMDQALRLAAAYALYSGCSLSCAEGSISWKPPGPPPSGNAPGTPDQASVADLEAKVKALEARLAAASAQAPPPPPPFNTSSVQEFLDLSGKPKWMNGLGSILLSSLNSVAESAPQESLVEIWHFLLRTHQDYSQQYNYHRHPLQPNPSPLRPTSSTPRFRAVKASFTLAEAQAKGAVPFVEQTPSGPATFVILEGRKFYLSQRSGVLWDALAPPPGPCNKCGADHWQWQCTPVVHTSPSHPSSY